VRNGPSWKDYLSIFEYTKYIVYYVKIHEKETPYIKHDLNTQTDRRHKKYLKEVRDVTAILTVN